MASYYRQFSDVKTHELIYDRVRWVKYIDAISGKELFSGCMPVYDLKQDTAPLMGVTCMDVNMIADYDEIIKDASWAALEESAELDSRVCTDQGDREAAEFRT